VPWLTSGCKVIVESHDIVNTKVSGHRELLNWAKVS
jgi:hypothetical protein